ncbi:MAG: DNA (cytosine-5-)-methyltransferase [Actinobacteria bacterium]|nr:DNA (cytosine-5-)-methyltransferase [Actinomycetota bacterium]|tara:strand:- start:145 stop:1284 length:1140 start_codon:yes stop_codon:yes gene_type:complete
MTSELTAIDLFCGAGGLSEGLRQAGFHVLAGNDFDEAAGATYARTHKEARFLKGPIQNLTVEDFLRAARLKPGQLSVLAGGPPCQAYSVYNHQRGMHDERSFLFKEYLRLVDGLAPEWVIMENVMGLLSTGQGAAVRAITEGFKSLGYDIAFKVLKAEEYGVPQERRRVVFIGNRMGKPINFPSVTHGPELEPLTTVFDAISDLPRLKNGEAWLNSHYASEPRSSYQTDMRRGTPGVLNHAAPRLAKVNEQRMRHIPPGGSWRDIPIELLPAGMKKARRCDHTKRYGRLEWHGLSSTILTKCDIHWGAYIHPDDDRSLTVREAARFQSFPDWFEFEGSRTEQFVQVGNAVPPLLGRALGEEIKKSILGQAAKRRLRVAA